MTAPLGQRVRCALFGHDWRRAIGPREGFYFRCRRCWVSEEAEEQAQVSEVSAPQVWQHTELQRHA
ncbi:MAG TPA: DUF1660 family phage protein [Solirubrobacterales bacterium]|nr:DUF1660 family phage protein [Solirubrobacterales bacterium]